MARTVDGARIHWSTEIGESESGSAPPGAALYDSLNEAGSRVWQLFSEGHDVDAIATGIVEEWCASKVGALRHARSFLRELGNADLVETTSTDAASQRVRCTRNERGRVERTSFLTPACPPRH
jgi:hypothetical protein